MTNSEFTLLFFPFLLVPFVFFSGSLRAARADRNLVSRFLVAGRGAMLPALAPGIPGPFIFVGLSGWRGYQWRAAPWDRGCSLSGFS